MYSESIKLCNEHFRVNWTCTSESIMLHNNRFKLNWTCTNESIKLHNEHFRVNWTCTVSPFSYVMNTLVKTEHVQRVY
jgi:hypothetical protein